MKLKFDNYVERRGTNCVKWDNCKKVFGVEDILPMWVADSDWPVPDVALKAIKERACHGILGYTSPGEDLSLAVINWVKKQYNWDIKKEWLVFVSGVVPAINVALRSYVLKGEGVILQSPVYYPFFSAVKDNGYRQVNNQLLSVNGYQMDFEGLKKGIMEFDGRVSSIILCNPHNPVGRVWKEEELQELGQICLEEDILIISDEIHADLIYNGQNHKPIASLSEELAHNTITMIAPSKTFNVAGLHSSITIIPNARLRRKYKRTMSGMVGSGNIFGFVAMQSVYTKGEEWLKEQMKYLEENRDFALDFFRREIPVIKAYKPEGTYLLWLDCRNIGIDASKVNDFMTKKARVGLDDGAWFGPGGEGFVRLNFACSRVILKKGLNRIREAIKLI